MWPPPTCPPSQNNKYHCHSYKVPRFIGETSLVILRMKVKFYFCFQYHSVLNETSKLAMFAVLSTLFHFFAMSLCSYLTQFADPVTQWRLAFAFQTVAWVVGRCGLPLCSPVFLSRPLYRTRVQSERVSALTDFWKISQKHFVCVGVRCCSHSAKSYLSILATINLPLDINLFQLFTGWQNKHGIPVREVVWNLSRARRQIFLSTLPFL